jgi:hypothetical protein
MVQEAVDIIEASAIIEKHTKGAVEAEAEAFDRPDWLPEGRDHSGTSGFQVVPREEEISKG